MPIVSGHNKRCSTTLIYGVNISSSGQKKLKTFYLIIKCCGVQGRSVIRKRKNNGMYKTSFDFNAWFVSCIPLNVILSRMSSGFIELRCLHHAETSLAEDRNHRRRLWSKMEVAHDKSVTPMVRLNRLQPNLSQNWNKVKKKKNRPFGCAFPLVEYTV